MPIMNAKEVKQGKPVLDNVRRNVPAVPAINQLNI